MRISNHFGTKHQTYPTCEVVVLPTHEVITHFDQKFRVLLIQRIQHANNITQEESWPWAPVLKSVVTFDESERSGIYLLEHILQPFGNQPVSTESTFKILRRLAHGRIVVELRLLFQVRESALDRL